MVTLRIIFKSRARVVGWLLVLAVGVVYFVAAHRLYLAYLNYTFVIAEAFLHGQLGVREIPSWLGENVPRGGWYYSAFPLGSNLVMLPFAAMKAWRWVVDYPVALVVGLQAAVVVGLGYAYVGCRRSDMALRQRSLLALWIPLGTWFLPNLLFAGSWELTLGWAVIGQLGALYFTLCDRRPWLAGLLLAVAYGNRTEVLLTLPAYMVLWLRPFEWRRWRQMAPQLAGLVTPVMVLLAATLIYNQARFGQWNEFGYNLIPGMLQEPWYRDGIFSFSYIIDNARTMLWHVWSVSGSWPYVKPDPFGDSILLASPFLWLLAWRWRRGDALVLWLAGYALAVLTFLLWIHGNTGGWQFSYRYAMVLLPWLLVVFAERLPCRVVWPEAVLWGLSVGINMWATYLFLWSPFGRW